MIYSLTELDDAAERVRACNGYFDLKQLREIKQRFAAGRYGRDWHFQRWLHERCDLERPDIGYLAEVLEDEEP